MRARQPMHARGGYDQRRKQRGDQEIAAHGKLQPDTEPHARTNRKSSHLHNPAQAVPAMRQAEQHVRPPFPSYPGCTGPRKRIRVGTWQGEMRENRFPVSNMPTAVRIAQELMSRVENEQDRKS